MDVKEKTSNIEVTESSNTDHRKKKKSEKEIFLCLPKHNKSKEDGREDGTVAKVE